MASGLPETPKASASARSFPSAPARDKRKMSWARAIITLHNSPFLSPLELIESLVTQPMRRRCLDSFDEFLAQSCKVDSGHQSVVEQLADGEGWVPIIVEDLHNMYQIFCAREDLSTELSTPDDFRLRLMAKDGVRVVSESKRCRLQGARLHRHPRIVELAPDASLPDLFKAFVRSNIKVKRNRDRVVNLQDGWRPDGRPLQSLDWRFREFCKAHGCQTPSLNLEEIKDLLRADLTEHFEKHRLQVPSNGFFKEDKINVVTGIRCWKPDEDDESQAAPITSQWYWMQVLKVFLELAVLLAPVFGVFLFLIAAQSTHAMTTSTNINVLCWDDVLGRYPIRGGFPAMFMLAKSCMTYVVVYSIATLVRIVVFYMDFESHNMGGCCGCNLLCVEWTLALFKILYAFFLLVHVFYGFVVLGMTGAWLLLAALLNPTRFLPYGTAVVVTFLVVSKTYSELQAASEKFKAMYRKAFSNKVMASIRHDNVEFVALTEIGQELGSTLRKRRVSVEEIGESDPRVSGICPKELFKKMDTSGDGKLQLQEFEKKMLKLKLGMSKDQILQLAAYCDKDRDAFISEAEFRDAWHLLEKYLEEAAAENCGLSSSDRIFLCLVIFSGLFLIFAFIFLALQGWYSASSFDSMVQSILVAASGGAVKRMRAKSDAEGEDSNLLQNKIFSLLEQTEGNGGDEEGDEDADEEGGDDDA